ncbi:hypothetical protein DL95DRAFT_412249 [Leptodontidium sp. 2 PMI_412]|nr:hypothetical protein DL95DRAFT_412249 [Leptodontidium sp. 2 PMI_412]
MGPRQQLPRRCKAPRSSEPTRRSTRIKCTPSQEPVESLGEESDFSIDDITDNASTSSNVTPRRSTRGKWPPLQETFDNMEEEGDLTINDIKDNASMLSYVNKQPRPAVYTSPYPPALTISSPSLSSPLSSIASSTPPPPQSFISNLPYPIVPNEILDRPKPKNSHTDNLRAPMPDRRLLLTNPDMWWNNPLQARTNPSSDRCYECANGRTKGKCSLETTSYPCTACVDKGMEDSCRNGLPSSRWERRMLEEKRKRDGIALLPVLDPAPAPVGAASGSGSKSGRDPDDDGGVGSSRGSNSNQCSFSLRPSIARSDALDDERVHPDSLPQNPNRNFNQVRNSGSGPSICDRCFRLDLICPLEKPCPYCLQAGETCQDSHTHQVYTEIGPTPYLDFEAQPVFPPGGDLNLHAAGAVLEAAEAGFPAADNGGAAPEGVNSSPCGPRRDGQGLENEDLFNSLFFDDEILFPPWEIDEHGELVGGNSASLNVLAAVPGNDVDMDVDMDINMNMGDNPPALYPMTPPGRNQSSEDYEDGVDRAIEEMLVALRTWPAVEVTAPTPPGLYYEPFDNTALNPALSEALKDAARKRKLRDRMIAYQMYRRDHPRSQQPPSPPHPSPVQAFAPDLPPFAVWAGNLALTIQPPAPQVLPQAAPAPPPFQPQIPQPPVQAPAYNLPYYAAWSWDGSGIINGPTPWPFTRVKPSRKVNTGEYGIYENMYDGKCIETKRSMLFPSGLGNQNNTRAERGNVMAMCGDTPVKACDCIEAAQAEHKQNEHLTCLECFDMRARHAPYRGVGPEERKLFLCVPCANIALGQNGLNVTVYPDCLCQTTLSNSWLCHMHRDKVDEEYVAALANSDAALIKLGAVGRCISCYVNVEDRNSGAYSCKICRDWVAVNPPMGYVPQVSAVQGGPFGK